MECDNTSSLIRLNVSGAKFILQKRTLACYPDTRLGKIAFLPREVAEQYCDVYLEEDKEFYFERSAKIFQTVASYYSTGLLHAPHEHTMCPVQLLEDWEYWGVDHKLVAPCCEEKVPQVEDDALEDSETHGTRISSHHSIASTKKPSRREIQRIKLWRVLERPFESTSGKAFATLSLLILAASTTLVILSSFKEFQVVKLGGNMTDVDLTEPQRLQRKRHRTLVILHNCCAVWFACEFVLRFLATPNYLEFMKKPLVILDMLSFLPYFITLGLVYAGIITNMNYVRQSMMVFRMLRMFQILRFLENFETCQIVLTTLKKTKTDICFLTVLIFMLVLVLSTGMYCVETSNPNSPIDSIPVAMYWCFITITTVGYGDVIPAGPVGKMIACLITLLGVVLLSLPVSIVVTKFTRVYGDKLHSGVLEQALRRRCSSGLRGRRVSVGEARTQHCTSSQDATNRKITILSYNRAPKHL